MAPIKTEFIKFKKCDLTKNRLLIAIDSGNSLTKVLFINKKNKDEFFNENFDTLTLEFNLFLNEQFEEAVEFIKLHALLLEDNDYKVHITGVFAVKNQNKVKLILNKDAIFIDEMFTISSGIKIALEQIGIDNMIIPSIVEEDYGTLDNDMFNKMVLSMKSKFNALNNSTYPCLFHVHGSGSGCFYFDKNGVSEFVGPMNPAGKTFLGLAKCLLDTNDYNEIIDLASRGDKRNVDTLVREMFNGDVNSPYGSLPPDLPMFPFGQCGDYNKGLEELRREDIALSLISLHAHNIIGFCRIICIIKKIPKIYIIGNIFNSNLFQSEMMKNANMLPSSIEFVFLNFGYFGVLGAIFSDETKSIHS